MKRTFETVFTAYESSEQIGEGGTSWVYSATDDVGNRCAIKLLKTPNGVKSEVTKRFKNEIQFCRKEFHSGIVRILDSGLFEIEGKRHPFYVMPLFDSSLRSIIRLSDEAFDKMALMGQMLDSVEAAHLAGAVHRDIKPENFLINRKEGRLVLADFGIAAFMQEELYTLVATKDGTRLANFQYASPEQRTKGAVVDHRTDIYSLGLMINEIFTNSVPHGTGYEAIGLKRPDLSFLDPLVERMIAQDPDKRYQSIAEVKKDLIGRKLAFIQLQKLDEEKRRVIQVSEIDHPLLRKPIALESVDWNENILEFHLNQIPDRKWLYVFQNLRNFEFFPGKEPARFVFQGKVARIGCEANSASQQVEMFKKWLTLAQQQFLQVLHEENAYEVHNKRQEQEHRIAMEEQRRRVLGNIQI